MKLILVLLILFPLFGFAQIDRGYWKDHLKDADKELTFLVKSAVEGKLLMSGDTIVKLVNVVEPVFIEVPTAPKVIEVADKDCISIAKEKSQLETLIKLKEEETKQLKLKLDNELAIDKPTRLELKMSKEETARLKAELAYKEDEIKELRKEAVKLAQLETELKKQENRKDTQKTRIENRGWGFWDWIKCLFISFGLLAVYILVQKVFKIDFKLFK